MFGGLHYVFPAWLFPHVKGSVFSNYTLRVTIIRRLFSSRREFHEDISPWIVSKVTDMSAMFQGVAEFNLTVNGRGLSKRPFWFRFGVTYK